MDRAARAFLDLLVSEMSVVRHGTSVLMNVGADAASKREAARSVFRALCISLDSFDLIGRRELQTCELILNEYDDLRELNAIGRYCLIELDKAGIMWPPPDVKPPAIVQDLFYFYDSVKLRHRQGILVPGGMDDVIAPIRDKVCPLGSDSWDWEEGADGTRALVLVSRDGVIRDYARRANVPEEQVPPDTTFTRGRARPGGTAMKLLAGLGLVATVAGGFNDITDLPSHVVEGVTWIVQAVNDIRDDINLTFEMPPPDLSQQLSIVPIRGPEWLDGPRIAF